MAEYPVAIRLKYVENRPTLPKYRGNLTQTSKHYNVKLIKFTKSINVVEILYRPTLYSWVGVQRKTVHYETLLFKLVLHLFKMIETYMLSCILSKNME